MIGAAWPKLGHFDSEVRRSTSTDILVDATAECNCMYYI